MLIKNLNIRDNKATLKPESNQDLWTLRRIIEKGDMVSSRTKRVIKYNKEFSRPDKGERINVNLSVEVENIALDNTLNRLKVRGKIIDTSDESITKGSFHSIMISEGYMFSLKKKKLQSFQINLIKKSAKEIDRILIIAVDMREACLGMIIDTSLKILEKEESGITGKMYSNKTSMNQYIDTIVNKTIENSKFAKKIIIVGPGEIKKKIFNKLEKYNEIYKKTSVLDGIDLSGEDGVYMSLRSPKLRELLNETNIAKAEELIHETNKRIAIDDKRLVFTLKETLKAGKTGAIESILVSNNIFEHGEEEEIIEILNYVDKYKGKTLMVDETTDAGKQVESLGGIIGFLRYPLSN